MENFTETAKKGPCDVNPWASVSLIAPFNQPETVGPDGYTDRERLRILRTICKPFTHRKLLGGA